jgi:chemotaxis protein MotB
MMSLLLTFFILIVALSEIKTEHKWKAILDEVHRAFGMQAGAGRMPTKFIKMSLTKQLTRFEFQQRRHKKIAEVDDPSIEGRQLQVTSIREGKKFVVGGRITFEPGSADLSEEGKEKLIAIVDKIKGHKNKIELRGHAGSVELAGSSQFNDLWTLSFERSKAVMEYLTKQQGISADRIRLISNDRHEPLRQRVITPQGQKINRRVEVVVAEELVEQFAQPQDPDATLNPN